MDRRRLSALNTLSMSVSFAICTILVAHSESFVFTDSRNSMGRILHNFDHRLILIPVCVLKDWPVRTNRQKLYEKNTWFFAILQCHEYCFGSLLGFVDRHVLVHRKLVTIFFDAVSPTKNRRLVTFCGHCVVSRHKYLQYEYCHVITGILIILIITDLVLN